MNYNHHKNLTPLARYLRKNMTKEERKLWYQFLKFLPLTIRRQKNISNYIVDFYCAKAKIVIELDGSQHYKERGKQSDIERDNYLKSLGIKVLRYSNLDVNKNFEGVCKDIIKHITNTSSVIFDDSFPSEGKL